MTTALWSTLDQGAGTRMREGISTWGLLLCVISKTWTHWCTLGWGALNWLLKSECQDSGPFVVFGKSSGSEAHSVGGNLKKIEMFKAQFVKNYWHFKSNYFTKLSMLNLWIYLLMWFVIVSGSSNHPKIRELVIRITIWWTTE